MDKNEEQLLALQQEVDSLKSSMLSFENSMRDMDNSTNELSDRVSRISGAIKSDSDEFGSPVVNERSIDNSIKTSGSITMRTDDTLYKLSVLSQPKKIEFYGNAVHYAGGVAGTGALDVRSMVVGSCFIGTSYYFQPKSTTEVVPGGIPQQFIQSSSYILTVNAVDTINAIASEGHLVSVEYPAGTPAARATVEKVERDAIYIRTYLLAGWEINGNFVIS